MIKKYEIINDGGKKRIKALRSFHVQGRYVNIGDVGGIVYDENTLSQEGNCWIFSGNLNYPSIRVGGDSIVDTNGYEGAVTDPRPFVNVTGTSALIGAHDFVTSAPSVEAYIDINDSRLEFQYTSAMTVATKVNPGNATSGVLKSVIDTSNVIISKTGNGAFVANIFAEVVKCNAEWRLISARGTLIGNFTNVDRLLLDGTVEYASTNSVKSLTTVRDCRTFALSTSVFPLNTANDAITARMPFIFTRCNVPNGIFYHNAKAKNIYTDIDFAKASVDLGKTVTGTAYKLASSEVEGMYRIYDTVGKAYGCLVEAYDSVAGLTSVGSTSYNTTIYKDAYFNGKFEFAGTNVFGNKVPGHPRAVELKAKPRVVQGTLNALAIGSTVTGVAPSRSAVVTPIRYRINSGEGISVKNIPGGIQVQIVAVNERNVIEGISGAVTTAGNFSNYAKYTYAFINFSKTDYTPITPDELGDTTITVYNGCKIVNTGTTAINMKGNIRVEDNATLVNASVVGSGYFGGDSVTENANVQGCMYIKDNAAFAPVAEADKSDNQIHLEGNARFLAASRATVNAIKMSGNSVFLGTKTNSTIDIDLRDNAEILGKISGSGTLVMEESASIEADTTVIGTITLSGNYKGDVVKTWTGKRTITDVNEPEYDNNVKTQYDF